MTTTDHELGDRLRRLAPWADNVAQVHQTAVNVAIDKLAVLLGMTVEDAPTDTPTPQKGNTP